MNGGVDRGDIFMDSLSLSWSAAIITHGELSDVGPAGRRLDRRDTNFDQGGFQDLHCQQVVGEGKEGGDTRRT